MDLTGLPAFLVVAETHSFRAGAERTGVTRSAVSQALRVLETRLGVVLFRRTTRSVSLTEAGRDIYERHAPVLAEAQAAVEAAGDHSGCPPGHLRLAVSSIAEGFLSGPLLAGFARAFPEIQLDVTVTDEEFDIAKRGFDAGVRLVEVLAQHVIAVPVSAHQQHMVVGAPSYVERCGAPWASSRS